MIKIVKAIGSGLISTRTANFKYSLCRNTLKLFITIFSITILVDEFSNQMYKVFPGQGDCAKRTDMVEIWSSMRLGSHFKRLNDCKLNLKII